MIPDASSEPDDGFVIQVVLGPAVDGGFYLIGAVATPEGFLQVLFLHCQKAELRLPRFLEDSSLIVSVVHRA